MPPPPTKMSNRVPRHAQQCLRGRQDRHTGAGRLSAQPPASPEVFQSLPVPAPPPPAPAYFPFSAQPTSLPPFPHVALPQRRRHRRLFRGEVETRAFPLLVLFPPPLLGIPIQGDEGREAGCWPDACSFHGIIAKKKRTAEEGRKLSCRFGMALFSLLFFFLPDSWAGQAWLSPGRQAGRERQAVSCLPPSLPPNPAALPAALLPAACFFLLQASLLPFFLPCMCPPKCLPACPSASRIDAPNFQAKFCPMPINIICQVAKWLLLLFDSFIYFYLKEINCFYVIFRFMVMLVFRVINVLVGIDIYRGEEMLEEF